jgi:RNase H-like domain found in reverse transcriptase
MYGIGGVLDQDNNKKFIRFFARSLQPNEVNYWITQKELLAIVYSIEEFKPYLWGTHFKL